VFDHPRRLNRPRRVGERGSGEWEEIEWDVALDAIAERLLAIRAESGTEAVAYLNQARAFDKPCRGTTPEVGAGTKERRGVLLAAEVREIA
jgi:anaerobic selenocysteine-containing dehydrogenase